MREKRIRAKKRDTLSMGNLICRRKTEYVK